MIEVRGLIKRYGTKVAVNDLSFDVEPGHVTGFLGPNGAGKTTTMRLILGLDYPDAGIVKIDGKQFASLANPMREVGALLDAKAVHGGRSAYNHLLCLAQTNNLPKRRVGEVLELVGLTEVARKRTKGFSDRGRPNSRGCANSRDRAYSPDRHNQRGRLADRARPHRGPGRRPRLRARRPAA